MSTSRKIIITFVVLLLLVTLWGVINFFLAVPDDRPVACTEEAKLCADGSAVGRT